MPPQNAQGLNATSSLWWLTPRKPVDRWKIKLVEPQRRDTALDRWIEIYPFDSVYYIHLLNNWGQRILFEAHHPQRVQVYFGTVILPYRAFSLTWPVSMQIYWNKRNHLHKKRVQLPQDWFGTPTWLPFHCFRTPKWPPWRHAKTLYICCS